MDALGLSGVRPLLLRPPPGRHGRGFLLARVQAVNHTTGVFMGNQKHECDNCGKRFAERALREIKDYFMRVEAGGVVPSGECPACGALCYPVVRRARPTPGGAFYALAPREHVAATVRAVRLHCVAKGLVLAEEGEQVLVETLNDLIPAVRTRAGRAALAGYFATHPRLLAEHPGSDGKERYWEFAASEFLRIVLYETIYRRCRSLLKV